MPTKFRKNVWIKRGDYVLVQPIEEGDKVKAEIVQILMEKHHVFEKHSFVLLLGILIAVSIGGLVEIVPLFYLKSTIETAAGVRPRTPLEQAGFDVVTLTPSATRFLGDLIPIDRQAILFGAEGPGLPAEILARTRGVSIPMAGGFDSLNVATTSGIVLHHLTRTVQSAPNS